MARRQKMEKLRKSIKKVICEKTNGVTENLRKLNPCIDFRMLTSAIFVYVSSAAGRFDP